MQEFCPLCSKNGVKTKIKAYQLNDEEAVFMCSTEQCTWPVGYQELTFISRPIGKDWAKDWDKLASKHLKSEHDGLLEFQAYTPPQTPGTEVNCKDNGYTLCATTVPNNVSETMPTIMEEIDFTPQEFSTALSKPRNVSTENSINNSIVLKPKLVNLKPVNYKLEKSSTKGYMVSKDNENSDTLSRVGTQLTNFKNIITIPTSLTCSSVVVKENKLRSSLSIMRKVKEEPSGGSKVFNRRKTVTCPYRKFSLNDLQKVKSTNIDNESKISLIKMVKSEEKPQECLSESNSTVKNEFKDLNLIKVVTKEERPQEGLSEFNSNVQNGCKDLNLIMEVTREERLQEGLSEFNSNVQNGCNDIGLSSLDSIIVHPSNSNSQVDFDSILALTNSKDSGVELTENADLDFDLDELLTGFSDDLGSTLLKPKLDDTDDSEWLDSLFL